MRSSWYFRKNRGTRTQQVLWGALGLFVVLFYFVRRIWVALGVGGWTRNVDQPVNRWVLEHQDSFWQAVAVGLYWWGSTPGMTVTMILVSALLCWWTRSAWPLATIAFTALGSVLATIVLKSSLHVVRPIGVPGGPEPPQSFSFPSGHTLNAAALIGIAGYLAISYGLRRHAVLIASLAALFVLAMGASRIYLGHHWVSDVAVGLMIGVGWAAVVAVLHYFFVPPARPRQGA